MTNPARTESKAMPLRPLEDGIPLREKAEESQQLSLLALANVLLRQRRIVFGVPLLVLVFLLVPWTVEKLRGPGDPTFTAITTFDVESGGSTSGGASSLAAQLGLAVAQPSPPPYERLLRSRALLIPVAGMTFILRDGRRGTFGQLLRIRGASPGERLERTIASIRSAIVVGSDKVGTPALMVTTNWPELSMQLADSLVARLNAFNTGRQQSKVSRERRFTEARLEEKRQELRAAEGRMEAFLAANREYRNSPSLTFQFDRINRDLQLRQLLYNTLASTVETARIEEVRNSPVVSVIEPAYVPAKFEDDGPQWMPEIPVKGIVRVILALVFAVFLAFAREFYLRNRAETPDDAEEFTALRRKTLADLRRPWKLFSRPARQPPSDR